MKNLLVKNDDFHTGSGATIVAAGGNESFPCTGDDCILGTLVVMADDFILSNVRVANGLNDSSAGKNFALNLAGDRMSVFHSSFFGKDDMFYTGGKRIFVAHSTLNGSTGRTLFFLPFLPNVRPR